MPDQPDAKPLRIGLDVGGTFTDLALVDEPTGRISFHKVPSTPSTRRRRSRPASAAPGARPPGRGGGLPRPRHDGRDQHGDRAPRRAHRPAHDQGLPRRAGDRRGRPGRICTTTTSKPPPLVPRRHRLEIDERIAAERCRPATAGRGGDGPARRRPLREDGSAPSRSASCTSSATRARARGESACSSASCRTSISQHLSEVLPEFREFDRFSTTVMNAFVGPRMARYLDRLLARREGARASRRALHRPFQWRPDVGGDRGAPLRCAPASRAPPPA